jgi:transposase InsO family protein
MKYSPTVKYVTGKSNSTADALSRAPVSSAVDGSLVGEIEGYMSVCFPESTLLSQVKEAQREDAICQELSKLIHSGWPAYKTDANKAIHPYWDQRHHITEGPDGVILLDQRLLIPSALRVEMLDRIHAAHQGVGKCRERAKRLMWWPMMSLQIKEMVEACLRCRKASNTPVEPLMPSTLPDRPWERVAADLFEFEKQHYILLVDYYSRWIEVKELRSLSSQEAIKKVKEIFSTHGVADILVSDNGPQFSSKEFHDFTQEYCFQHVTSSPRYPRGNGEAERAVKTIKRLWEKSMDKEMALLLYRATPLSNGYSPSELLMGRLLKSNLPATVEQLRPAAVGRDVIQEQEESTRLKTKANHDTRHRAVALPTLRPGDPVIVRDSGAQAIVQAQVAPRSYTVKTPTGILRRNRAALVGAEVPGSSKAIPANQPEFAIRRKKAASVGAEVLGSSQANPANQPKCAVGPGGAEVPGSSQANPASPRTDTRSRRVRRTPGYLKDYVTDLSDLP